MMRNLLKKFKIIETVELSLNTTKDEFQEKLNTHVQPGSLGVFNALTEMFANDKRAFIGSVKSDEFNIKLKRQVFSFNRGIATAKGNARKHNGKLVVKTEINGFHSAFRILLTVLGLMYLIGFIALAVLAAQNSNIGLLYGLLGLLVHMIFIFGLFYFIGRAGTKKLKSELIFVLNK